MGINGKKKWIERTQLAGVEGHSPHDARNAMGKYLIEKTGNLAAVQRQLGHTNATYSLQYTRISDEELGNVLEDRQPVALFVFVRHPLSEALAFTSPLMISVIFSNYDT